MENAQSPDDLSMDESISPSSSPPYFKDVGTQVLFNKKGQLTDEHFFWQEFFKDDDDLLNLYKDRVLRNCREFQPVIKWDFLPGSEHWPPRMKDPDQYRQALTFVEDCITGKIDCHFQRNCENSKRLEDWANRVVAIREKEYAEVCENEEKRNQREQENNKEPRTLSARELQSQEVRMRSRESHVDILERWRRLKEVISQAVISDCSKSGAVNKE